MYLVKETPTVVLCERCGQELTDPESITRRMGPECALSASQQFAAISDLTLAISTGWFDPIANKFLTEKRIIETVLNRARQQANYHQIKTLTKKLQRVNGILVRRELMRVARQQPQGAA